MDGEPAVDAALGSQDDISRAYDRIRFGKTAGALPHAHHVVGNVTLPDQ